MTDNVRSAIGWWKNLGAQQDDQFLKLFLFYMCLDAWMTSESGEDSDAKKLKWLIGQPNDLKTHWDDIKNGSKTQSWLHGLAKDSPLEDMRPSMRGNTKGYAYLTDTADFE
jgi:hypothetical protein